MLCLAETWPNIFLKCMIQYLLYYPTFRWCLMPASCTRYVNQSTRFILKNRFVFQMLCFKYMKLSVINLCRWHMTKLSKIQFGHVSNNGFPMSCMTQIFSQLLCHSSDVRGDDSYFETCFFLYENVRVKCFLVMWRLPNYTFYDVLRSFMCMLCLFFTHRFKNSLKVKF